MRSEGVNHPIIVVQVELDPHGWQSIPRLVTGCGHAAAAPKLLSVFGTSFWLNAAIRPRAWADARMPQGAEIGPCRLSYYPGSAIWRILGCRF